MCSEYREKSYKAEGALNIDEAKATAHSCEQTIHDVHYTDTHMIHVLSYVIDDFYAHTHSTDIMNISLTTQHAVSHDVIPHSLTHSLTHSAG